MRPNGLELSRSAARAFPLHSRASRQARHHRISARQPSRLQRVVGPLPLASTDFPHWIFDGPRDETCGNCIPLPTGSTVRTAPVKAFPGGAGRRAIMSPCIAGLRGSASQRASRSR